MEEIEIAKLNLIDKIVDVKIPRYPSYQERILIGALGYYDTTFAYYKIDNDLIDVNENLSKSVSVFYELWRYIIKDSRNISKENLESINFALKYYNNFLIIENMVEESNVIKSYIKRISELIEK